MARPRSQTMFGNVLMHLDPPLYDYKEYIGKSLAREEKGLYDYDLNIFKIPTKLKKMFEWKRKDDLEFMESLGIEYV
jgi:hypothetical protein